MIPARQLDKQAGKRWGSTELLLPAVLFLGVASILTLSCGEPPSVDHSPRTQATQPEEDVPRPVPHERALRVPRGLRVSLAKNPEAHLAVLVDALTSGIESDSLKAKIIHDWVADNISYDVQGFLSRKIGEQGVADVIRTGRSVCQGYSNLYERMCADAGVECVTISGYGRGYGFSLFETEDPPKENHAWNAVKLNGTWRLVDVTWDAGHVDGGRYEKDYSTGYWLADPLVFLSRHYPADPQWQLLEDPLSRERFVELPPLRPEFFEYGLAFDVPRAKLTDVASTACFTIRGPADVWLMADVTGGDSERKVRDTPSQSAGGPARFVVQLPEPGNWRVRLYARRGGQYGSYRFVGELGFVIRRPVL
jgi:hypothetical protein